MSPAGAFILSCTTALCTSTLRPMARAAASTAKVTAFSMGPSENFKAAKTRFGTMRYRTFGSVDTAAPRILFIHGLGSSSQTAQPPEEQLATAGFLVPDLLGHGDSARPADPEAYRMRSQAEAIVNVLDAEPTTGELFLIAHSYAR